MPPIAVRVRNGRQTRTVMLPPAGDLKGGGGVSELAHLFRTLFGTSGTVLGLRAVTTGQLFPLSMLANTNIFADHVARWEQMHAASAQIDPPLYDLVVNDGSGVASSGDSTSEEDEYAAANGVGRAGDDDEDDDEDDNEDDDFDEFRDGDYDDGESGSGSAASVGVGGILANFHLSGYEATELMNIFAEVDPSGALSRNTFLRTFQRYIAGHPGSATAKGASTETLSRLFDLFDVDGDGVVDKAELLSGLTVICAGDRDDKIRAAFDLYDLNGDGVISVEEITRFLTSVFRVTAETTPEVFAEHRVSPEELGDITARRCFAEADTNRDGTISFEEFRRWYSQPAGSAQAITKIVTANERAQQLQERHRAVRSAASDARAGAGAAAVAAGGGDDATAFPRLAALRRETGLGSISAEELFPLIQAQTGVDGKLDREEFRDAVSRALRAVGVVPESTDPRRTVALLDAIFFLFDTDQDGYVDHAELASGLSVLCRGSRDEKVAAAFALYDMNGDGFISLEEMKRYLTSVFRLLFEISDETRDAMGTSAEDLGRITAEQCFAEADLNHDGRLSFEEFQKWYAGPSAAMAAAASSLPSWFTIDEVRRLTNLSSYTVDTVVDVFARAANEEGVLDRASFQSCLHRFMGNLSIDDTERARLVSERLFDIFDADSNGVVDFSELASGLSVLCGGSRDDKVDAAFSLYDLNGDGYISLDEMQLYLTSVFKVLYETQKGTAERMGVPPEELARVTAEQCFHDADLNHDGRLSKEEFTRWYNAAGGLGASGGGTSGAGSARAVVDLAGDEDVSWVSLAEVRRLTGLERYPVDAVVEAFARRTNEEGVLDRDSFEETFEELFAGTRLSTADAERLSSVLTRLFDIFDADGNGVVDFSELASGLSVLCGGTRDQKVESAFALYDINGDGYISLEEMQLYLTSVFRVLFETQPGTRESMGVDPEDLAAVTAEQCFKEADLNHDGRLSYDEFRRWFTASGGFAGPSSSREVVRESVENDSWVSLAEVKRLTNLQQYAVSDVIEVFARGANEDGLLTREAFAGSFSAFLDAGTLTSLDRQRVRQVINRLFDVFDADGNGVVDFSELASGLSVLCGGSRQDKVESAFALYDVNGDGFISLEEMQLYLTSVFKVLYEAQPETRDRLGVSPEELAHVTAEQCFAEADLNHDGRLSFEEFKVWSERSGDIGGGGSGAAGAGGAQAVVVGSADVEVPEWVSVGEVKRLTGLGQYSADQVMDVFARVVNEDGVLPRAAFDYAFSQLIDFGHLSTEDADHARIVINRLFNIFDTDSNGVVDFSELAAGLSVLCGGPRNEKVDAAFALYDLDNDGYISLEEMKLYLTSVFKVLYETQRGTREQMGGVPPDELARVTAMQCFAEADANEDGLLSRDEFFAWYLRSGGAGDDEDDPRRSPSRDAVVRSAEMPVPGWLTLDVAKQLTGLHMYPVEEVIEVFARNVNEDGVLDRPAFNRSFSHFSRPSTDDDLARLNYVTARLFDSFDADGNGVVDFSELASGLSVLAGGSRLDKVEAAFALYDFNGDGYISLEEMQLYLSAVFKVLFQTQAGTAEAMGVSPEELAAVTASQCFAEADLNHDGRLSFEEFKAWTERSGMGGTGGGAAAPGGGVVVDAAQVPAGYSSTLSELRALTDFGRHDVESVFEVFARAANSEGVLDKMGFRSAFAQFVPGATAGGRWERVCARLFDVFDADGNGVVDFSELASGLSVLCGGSREDKVRAAFQLYDINGDGVISLDEMTLYLTSVFKVLYETQPGTAERMGVPAEELAAVTAEQCFEDADLNHDGNLSLDEFRAWYTRHDGHQGESGEGAAEAVIGATQGALPEWASLDEVRRLTNLHAHAVEDVVRTFARAADGDGTLSRDAFVNCFKAFVRPQPRSERARTREVLSRLFDLFDTDNDGAVDFSELAAGLTVLSGGSQDAKVESAFALYDINGDGYIQLDEMTEYLGSVFKVMYATQPGMEARLGVGSEELARVTAEQCFLDADVDHDGRLSFEEFKSWYETNSRAGSAKAAVHDVVVDAASPPRGAAAAAGAGALGESDDESWISLAEVKRLTSLGLYHVRDVMEVFAERANEEGVLERGAFERAFAEFLTDFATRDSKSLERTRLIIDRLFDIFDADDNGVVDFSELASGLSVLCAGSRDDKVRAAFALYDADGDGFISLDEMTLYLKSVFRVMYEAQPDTREQMGVGPDELAEVTAEQCFHDADLNHDGKLSFEEFEAWYARDMGGRRGVKEVVVDSAARPPAAASLDEAKRLTNLDKYHVHEVMEAFAAQADGEGLLNRDAFYAGFSQFLRPQPRALRERTRGVLASLFDLFDADGNGVVDFSELASGLSVLCGGSRDDKVEAAFALYDVDGDGYISLEEMTHYLGSVFKVLYETQPGTQEQMGGVGPEELARLTAEQCFTDADLNHDGKLSLDEFTAWYGRDSTSSGVRDTVVDTASRPPTWVSLAEVKRLTNLGQYHVDEVMEVFAHAADAEEGSLDRASFDRAFQAFLEDGSSNADRRRFSVLLDRLFDLFDTDGNDRVDFTELAAGLSVLAGGSRDDKVQAAFALYDLNGDGFISYDEMTHYLTSVFKVLYETDPGTQERMGVTAEDLAAVTAEQCFEDADLNHDGRLSITEFRNWYLAAGGRDMKEAVVDGVADSKSWLSVDEVKRLTHLGEHSVSEVLAVFAEHCNEEGVLDRESFDHAFRQWGSPASREDESHFEFVLEHLFDLFDQDGNGVVDFPELASGLSVLCRGTGDEKVEAAFALYDVDGDGHVALDEMTLYLASVFKVLYESEPDLRERMGGRTPEQMAVHTTEQVFRNSRKDRRGRLSLEAFKEWYHSEQGSELARLIVGSAAEPSDSLSMAEARRLTQLDRYPVQDVFEVFARAADEEGQLDRRAFNGCFQQFVDVSEMGRSQLERAASILGRLFDIFDADGNGVVDFSELASGLSVLCGGSRDDKVEAAFALYDVDRDGYISLDEMVAYLTAVFRVVYETQPGTREQMGVSPDELAVITSEQCFEEADINHDGKLSLDEFKEWYSRSLGDGVAGAVVGATSSAAVPPEWFSLAEVRRLANLQDHAAEDVIEVFAARVNDDGVLTRDAFVDCFSEFTNPADIAEAERVNVVMTRLFDLFDADGNGVVDFNEMVTGLSVLCGGTREDKVRTAFKLYDYDGDGYISLEEMTQYLTSVFKVLYESSPDVRASMGVGFDELARVTAEQCFLDADLDKDGRLTYEEFAKWYSSNGMEAGAGAGSGAAASAGAGSPGDSKAAQVKEMVVDNATKWGSLEDMRRMSGLEGMNVADVIAVFDAVANADGNIDRTAFDAAFSAIVERLPQKDQDRRRAHDMISRVFELFDTDSNGVVDKSELAAGLSILCGGGNDDKVKAAFDLYDLDGNGYITLNEMVRYLSSVYRVIYKSNPELETEIRVDADTLAEVTAEECFREADTNKDGRLEFSEFKAWFLENPDTLPTGADGAAKSGGGDGGGGESKADGDSRGDAGADVVGPGVLSATSVRDVLRLDRYNVDEVFDTFRENSREGRLTRDAFCRSFLLLSALGGGLSDARSAAKTDALVARLFDLFDKDGNGVVDYSELASGLTVFCSGSPDSKVRAAFALYDFNGDGYISLEEMRTYLGSVFRVMYELQPATEEVTGVPADELAAITAHDAFAEADLNNDGRLSFDEFRAWYARSHQG